MKTLRWEMLCVTSTRAQARRAQRPGRPVRGRRPHQQPFESPLSSSAFGRYKVWPGKYWPCRTFPTIEKQCGLTADERGKLAAREDEFTPWTFDKSTAAGVGAVKFDAQDIRGSSWPPFPLVVLTFAAGRRGPTPLMRLSGPDCERARWRIGPVACQRRK